MILRRLKNIWRLSAYEPINSNEPIKVDNLLHARKIEPVKKAEIIRKINQIDEFLKS